MRLGTREPYPLCTCPELTWDAATGRTDSPNLDACRARAFGGIDPHPVLTADDLRAIRPVAAYVGDGRGGSGFANFIGSPR